MAAGSSRDPRTSDETSGDATTPKPPQSAQTTKSRRGKGTGRAPAGGEDHHAPGTAATLSAKSTTDETSGVKKTTERRGHDEDNPRTQRCLGQWEDEDGERDNEDDVAREDDDGERDNDDDEPDATEGGREGLSQPFMWCCFSG